MRIAIADDDRNVINRVHEMMKAYTDQHGIPADYSLFETPQAFVDSLRDGKYSLVIMDIYFTRQPLADAAMAEEEQKRLAEEAAKAGNAEVPQPDTDTGTPREKAQQMTGVDAIRALREVDRKAFVIFLTDSSDHMPDAFSVHAYSYIIKRNLQTELPRVMSDLMSTIAIPRSITLKNGKQTVMLSIGDIVSIQTEGHYLIIRSMGDVTNRVRMTFAEMQAKLEKSREFLMINKGIMVNMDHIRDLSGSVATMVDGSTLPVRMRGQAAIVRAWRDYNFDKLREGGRL